MANNTSGNTIDLDIYGRDNLDGTAMQYIDSKAVGNALQMYLSSKKGDFLYAPSSGGILDSQTFRVMTLESLTMLQFNIRNALTNYFSPAIQIISINLEAMYDERALKITIIYSSGANVEKATVYTNAEFSNPHYEYVDVDYVGENLLKLCQIKKADMQGKYMELETNTDIWTWGNLRFVNFDFNEDPYAEDIMMVCNA